MGILSLSFAMCAALILFTTTKPPKTISPVPLSASASTTMEPLVTDSPSELIGDSDLVRLTVAHSSELTRSFRVDDQGNLNLPLLKEPVQARGLTPLALRDKIVAALRDQHLLVEPLVVVDIEESVSHQVPIYGAVQRPTTLSPDGHLNLLKALSQAGGLAPAAGQWIIVQQQDGTIQRIFVRDLFDGYHPGSNIQIGVGAQIVVPDAGRVFVMGDVRSPGEIPVTGAEGATVLRVLALAGGLSEHATNAGLIYRNVPGTPQATQIRVPLRDIWDRKAPDVQMVSGDILFVPHK